MSYRKKKKNSVEKVFFKELQYSTDCKTFQSLTFDVTILSKGIDVFAVI